MQKLRRAEMNITKFKIALLAFVFVLLSTVPGFSGASFNIPTTDRHGYRRFHSYLDFLTSGTGKHLFR